MAVVSKSRALAATATTVVAGLTAATALAVAPPPDSTFAGKTNQTKAKNRKVTLVTDANSHVKTMTLGWRAQCRKKGIFWRATTRINGGSDGIPQTGDVFHDAGTYTSDAGGGITGRVTIAMKGQFTDNDHANGTWKAKVTVKKNGNVIDKCKTSTIKWKVTRTG
jgi:hypothetical protein